MKKRFVTKKKNKIWTLKLIILIAILFASLVSTFNLLLKNSLNQKYDIGKVHMGLFTFGTNQSNLLSLDLLNPKDMFRLSLNYLLDVEEKEKPINEVELLEKHVNDTNPRIYIYSTHDTETYDSSLLESYNIKYNVKIGSYILSDYLKDLGIPTYVEEESMSDYLKANNLNYNHSYEASRHYILKRLEEFPSIEFIIDFHRDAIPRSASVVTIDGKNYAKIMTIAGVGYEGADENMAFAENINSKLEPRISRGILKRTGSQEYGAYNQKLNDKALLFEVGGNENTITEINNSLELLAKAIFDVMGGDTNGQEKEN